MESIFQPEALEQIVSAVFGALIVGGFYLLYRKTYLLHWTFSWIALGMSHLSVLLGWMLDIPRWPLAAVSSAAGFLHAVYLGFGMYELAYHRPVRFRSVRVFVIAGAVSGALLGLLATERADSMAHAAAAPVAICAAFLLWRQRGRVASGLSLFSVIMTISGVELLYGAIYDSGAFNTTAWPKHTGSVDVVIAVGVVLCMIIALIDDEREGAVLAASEIEHLAYHDPLTGLPNRALFFDRLMIAIANATRSNHSLAVLFLDLDRFKDINDSLGHSAGDQLLRTAARRISALLRQGDTLSRFGGDEFTVLLNRIEKADDVVVVARKVLNTLREPFSVAGRDVVVSCSIGISVFPSDGTDAESLVKNADTAMYRAKERGRDNYQLYAASMNSSALARLELENRLRKAVDLNELELRYQPVVDVEKGTVVGCEALLRWRHPEVGLITPDQFIEVAEVTGMIGPIGDWVLRRGCLDARNWQSGRPRIPVAINLSAKQLQQPELVQSIVSALREADLDASLLELEITESTAMYNMEHTIKVLMELRQLGVRIALDDFGTGYSSLSYLRRFPIDTLKLDRSFIRDMTRPGGGAIVTAVIQMAHALGVSVTAEGIELEEQWRFLKLHGCDRAQGYFFAKALETTQIDSFVRAQEQFALLEARDGEPTGPTM